jgi:hypothetical protein
VEIAGTGKKEMETFPRRIEKHEILLSGRAIPVKNSRMFMTSIFEYFSIL